MLTHLLTLHTQYLIALPSPDSPVIALSEKGKRFADMNKIKKTKDSLLGITTSEFKNYFDQWAKYFDNIGSIGQYFEGD